MKAEGCPPKADLPPAENLSQMVDGRRRVLDRMNGIIGRIRDEQIK